MAVHSLAALLHHFVSIPPPPSSSHAHFVTRHELLSRSTVDSLQQFAKFPTVTNFFCHGCVNPLRDFINTLHNFIHFRTMYFISHRCVVEFFINARKFVVPCTYKIRILRQTRWRQNWRCTNLSFSRLIVSREKTSELEVSWNLRKSIISSYNIIITLITLYNY